MEWTALLPLLKVVHILGALGFALVHGASATVALKVRGERDRSRIQALLELSGAYQLWAWMALLAVLVSGIVSGIIGGWWTHGLWLWASLVVFIAIAALMTPIPGAYLNDVRHAVGVATYNDVRKGLDPPPPVGDEELAKVLDSDRPVIGLLIGLAGFAILVWLMVVKPF